MLLCGSGDIGLQELKKCRKLRELAPSGQWSDLSGNRVTGGCAMAQNHPQISMGPVLVCRAPDLPDIAKYRYILIQRATFSRTSENEGSPPLDGDPIYQWDWYPSWKHAEAGLVEACGNGFSIMGSWAEFEVSKVDMTKWEHLIGEEISDESCSYFAAVGSRPRA